MRGILFAVALLGSALTVQVAVAQIAPLPELGFKLGGSIATVEAALKTTMQPEAMPRNPLLPANAVDFNQGKTVLHLRTKGIWVFFNASGAAETIRLDAPFSGVVNGVRLGDSTTQLTEKLGPPIRKPDVAFLSMQSYQYVLDDSAYVKYVTNNVGIQMILITR